MAVAASGRGGSKCGARTSRGSGWGSRSVGPESPRGWGEAAAVRTSERGVSVSAGAALVPGARAGRVGQEHGPGLAHEAGAASRQVGE